MRSFIALFVWIMGAAIAPAPAYAQFFGGSTNKTFIYNLTAHPVDRFKMYQSGTWHAINFTPVTLTTSGGSQTQTLWSLSGQGKGYIQELVIDVNNATDQSGSQNTAIKIYIDGESAPSINAPFGALFACYFRGADRSQTSSRYFRFSRGGNDSWGTMRLPIPFASSLQITVTNGSTTANTTVSGWARYKTGMSGSDDFGNAKKLYASWIASGTMANSATYTYANASNGPGVFLGAYVNTNFYPETVWLNTTFRIIADGVEISGNNQFPDWLGQGIGARGAPSTNPDPYWTTDCNPIYYDSYTGIWVIGARYLCDDPITFQSTLVVNLSTAASGAIPFQFNLMVFYYASN
ncbi:MAG TPA: DUF2961 domain-containing protein [Bryobacteraceae bacterium]|nr:DUF2961 domain-containing protein [Bryobacteraceae bacterium]